MKKIKSLYVLIIVAGACASLFIEPDFNSDPRPVSLAKPAEQAGLFEKNNTVVFQPDSKSNDIPMHFDRLDFYGAHRIEYFINNGYVGLRGEKDSKITGTNFPTLEVAFPSVPLKLMPMCFNGQYDLANTCPISEMKLSNVDSYKQEELMPILKVKQKARNNAPVRLGRMLKEQTQPYYASTNDLAVYQWMVFYTEKEGASQIQDQWLGWECNYAYLKKQNKKINSWAFEDNLWVQSLRIPQDECYSIGGPKQRLKQDYFSKWSKVTAHPVLWECSLGDDSCKAYFDYYGSMKSVSIPNGVVINDHPMNKGQQLRHKMLQTAWETLQRAARLAEAKQYIDSREALEQDLSQCQQVHLASKELEKLSVVHKSYLTSLWDRKDWAVSSQYPVGPCSRSMHRLIQINDGGTASALVKDQETLFFTAQQLIEIAASYDSSIDQPLKALENEFAKRYYGDGSVEAFAIVASDQLIFKKPFEMLAKYDAVAWDFNALPAETRVRIRSKLGHRLSDEQEHQRSRELFWLASKDLMDDLNVMPYIESVYLLMVSANATRSKSITPNENPPHVSLFIDSMQELAKVIALDKTVSASTKQVHLSALGMNAAYHAHHLALSEDYDKWQSWLENWYSWLAITLNSPSEENVPPYLQATKIHRDALRNRERPEPDCPGGRISGCSYYAPQR